MRRPVNGRMEKTFGESTLDVHKSRFGAGWESNRLSPVYNALSPLSLLGVPRTPIELPDGHTVSTQKSHRPSPTSDTMNLHSHFAVLIQ